jgi:hypothetical protein
MKGSSWFQKSWWVGGFCILALIVFAHAMKSRRLAICELSSRVNEMEEIGSILSKENEELKLRIASQSDPAWIELVLLREMGVVPEGFIKVHFKR